MTVEAKTVRDELAAFFAGLRDGDRKTLDALMALGDAVHPRECPWRAAAAAEIARRLGSFVGGFSFSLLSQLQLGSADPRAVAEAVLVDEKTPQPRVTSEAEDWELLEWHAAPLEVRKELVRLAVRLLDVPTLITRHWH